MNHFIQRHPDGGHQKLASWPRAELQLSGVVGRCREHCLSCLLPHLIAQPPAGPSPMCQQRGLGSNAAGLTSGTMARSCDCELRLAVFKVWSVPLYLVFCALIIFLLRQGIFSLQEYGNMFMLTIGSYRTYKCWANPLIRRNIGYQTELKQMFKTHMLPSEANERQPHFNTSDK